MDILMDSLGEDPFPLTQRARLWLHLLWCPRCAKEAGILADACSALGVEFFPPAPGLADRVMASLPAPAGQEEKAREQAGVSTRAWVIAGCIIMVSLVSAFFGFAFGTVADAHGTSFLLPFGITTGVLLSVYCALFIGCHIRELSARFNLPGSLSRYGT
jgi:hypothetical protein